MTVWRDIAEAHHALTGPRRTGASLSSEEAWKDEVLLTLTSIQEIRQRCDRTELRTVQEARKAGLSWTEIATALGVTRQSAWERWHELDETRPQASDVS
jgi:DNA invertase Pin-like site-specific DNA recombinase